MDTYYFRESSSSTHKDSEETTYLMPVQTQFWHQPTQYPAVYDVPMTWQQVMGMRGYDDGEFRQFFPFPIPIPVPPPIIGPIFGAYPTYPVYPPYPPYPAFRSFTPFW